MSSERFSFFIDDSAWQCKQTVKMYGECDCSWYFKICLKTIKPSFWATNPNLENVHLRVTFPTDHYRSNLL